MQEKSEQTQQRIITVGISFFLIAITILVFFNNAVDTILRETTRDTLNEVAAQQQLLINTDINYSQEYVVSVAESISSLGYNEKSLKQYLVTQIQNSSFQELAFFRTDGFTSSAYGKTEDIKPEPHFVKPYRKHASTSRPYNCQYSGGRVMDIAAPVYDGNVLVGVIIAKYSFSVLQFNLNNIIKGNGYALVSDGFALPAFATSSEFYTLEQLKNANLHDNDTTENIMKNIKRRVDGNFSFDIHNKNHIAIYKQLDINDWYLLLVLDEDKVTQNTKFLANTIAFISVGVLFILSFLLWYALHSKVESIKKIEKIAYYDDLTGLPNINKFRLFVLDTLKQYPHDEFAMIKIDISNFKAINEMFDFEVGNSVLRAFLKTSELANEKTFILARITGDEFIMFAGNGFLENLDDMTHFYEEYFNNAVPQLENYHLQFNYGRYFIKPGETDVNDMINKTTMTHAIAKTKKKGSIYNYDNNYKEQILQIADITNKMRKALNNKEFIPFLQPKYNINTKKVVGAEALVRWVDKDGTIMLPNLFIPLFEKNGFIIDLDLYILKNVCKTLKNWIDKGYECVPISVNVSRAHLENKHFFNQILSIVDKIEIPHHYIELELTESIVLENEEVLENLLSDLHSKGFLVSIDDFGSGYSSLGLLKNFKVNSIKLDRSFFNTTKEHSRGELVVDGIVKLANSLNIHVVAEGIEDEYQIAMLQRVQCSTIQGFYFNKAIPIDEFTQKYIQK